MVCHSLLQGIFPTQGLNPGVLHCWEIFTEKDTGCFHIVAIINNARMNRRVYLCKLVFSSSSEKYSEMEWVCHILNFGYILIFWGIFMLFYIFISKGTKIQLKYITCINKKNEKLDIINSFYWTFCFLCTLTTMMMLIFLFMVQPLKDRHFTTLCLPYDVFDIYNIGKTVIFLQSKTALIFPLRELYWCPNWAMHALYLSSLHKVYNTSLIKLKHPSE